MGQKEKLIKRFENQPVDFTFDELTRLFSAFGFELDSSYQGSRIKFEHKEKNLQYRMHKPHPSNIVKKYILKQVKELLTLNKLL